MFVSAGGGGYDNNTVQQNSEISQSRESATPGLRMGARAIKYPPFLLHPSGWQSWESTLLVFGTLWTLSNTTLMTLTTPPKASKDKELELSPGCGENDSKEAKTKAREYVTLKLEL